MLESSWNLMAHGDAWEGKWRGNWWTEWVASTLTLPRKTVYPALLPLMRTPRLPVVDWTDAPADLNGLVRFAARPNLVSARVPSHFKRSLPVYNRCQYSARSHSHSAPATTNHGTPNSVIWYFHLRISKDMLCKFWGLDIAGHSLCLMCRGKFCCYCSSRVCSQIFELFQPLKGTIINIYSVTSPRILISRHDHVLNFISIYFRSSKASVFYLYHIHSAQYIIVP
jgi:hypothetical protein